ncbi:MAG: DivIVA domain-containing protein [Jiangellaceae bacterium]
MLVVFVTIAVAVVFAVAAAAVGRGGGLDASERDITVPWLSADGPVSVEDLETIRFAVAFRGYRMDQVDEVLDRLGGELAARDARIAALEAMAARPKAAGDGPAE